MSEDSLYHALRLSAAAEALPAELDYAQQPCDWQTQKRSQQQPTLARNTQRERTQLRRSASSTSSTDESL